MTDDPVVRTRNLTKRYGNISAVGPVDLEVYPEEIFGVLGPNGAGKTTMVEILQCLRQPTSGTAEVLGFDVESDPYAIKERIGVVPQQFNTFERLTVRENVSLVGDLYTDSRSVDVVLGQLDLESEADTRFADLSGGYQRRTGIAMALVGDPDVLFLDEPTTGLDPAARRATWGQIETLPAQGTTVLLTSHYMEEVEALADRVALLLDGALAAVDTVPALIDEFGGAVKVRVETRGATSAEVEELADVLERDAEDLNCHEEFLIGRFRDRATAQSVYGDLADMAPQLRIELASAGMEDVFLELAEGRVTASGELR